MRWREAVYPIEMQRVALIAPRSQLRSMLVTVADEGTVAFDDPAVRSGPDTGGGSAADSAAALMRRLPGGGTAQPALSAELPDLQECERAGRLDLIAGEAQIQARTSAAVMDDDLSGLAGWMPSDDRPRLAERVAGVGGAVVPLPRPPGVDPPTLTSESGLSREFAPLIDTYGTVPYRDLNPSVLAGVAYVLMFGMMFADLGHGAILLLAAVAVRSGRGARLSRLRPVWVFLAGAGVASMVFGALYGEFFGPTGVIPVLWLDPLDNPIPLLLAAIGVGAVFLGAAYALGSVNRMREGGLRLALYAPSGLAGSAVFVGLGLVAGGLYGHLVWLVVVGGVVAAAGLGAAAVGLYVGAGRGASGGAQAAVELFDLITRLGSNLVSFARLAAFGLTHAALGLVVWQATTGAWQHGGAAAVAAVLIFLVGNAVTFALEGLIAGIQALRLEYYELFSRIFDREGRPFRPWHIPLAS